MDQSLVESNEGIAPVCRGDEGAETRGKALDLLVILCPNHHLRS